MTVSTTSTLSGPYTPNGVTTTFPFGFKVYDKTDLSVLRDAGSGVRSIVNSDDYSVTIGDNGGSVVFAVAPGTGSGLLYIELSPPFTNEIAFEAESSFLPQVHNEGFDRAAMRDQALKAMIDGIPEIDVAAQATVATTAADRAEAARDIALSSSGIATAQANQGSVYLAATVAAALGIFDTTSAGLAATSSTTNKYFFVKGSGDTFAQLYKNVSGSAVDQGLALPTVAAIQSRDAHALMSVLPADALGIWPFDMFSGTSIPNAANPAVPIASVTGTLSAGIFSGNGSITFGSTQALAKWTMSCLIKKQDIDQTYYMILRDAADYHNFMFNASSSQDGPANVVGNPGDVMQAGIPAKNAQGQRGGLFDLSAGYHVLTYTYDGTTLAEWLDDEKLLSFPVFYGARNIASLAFSTSPVPSQSHLNYAGFLGLWDRALSDIEVRSVVYQQRVRATAGNGVPTGTRTNRTLVIEGDSNHGQNSATCWPWLYGAHDSPAVFGAAWSISGSVIADLVARAPYVDAVIPPNTNGRKFIITIGVGTNDLAGMTSGQVATFISQLRAYGMARKAAGFIVAIFTIPPRADLGTGGNATFNTNRATVNADLAANTALYGASALIDIASDPNLGVDNSYALHPDLWQAPGLHFSDSGNALVETYARAVINAL